MNIDKNYFRNYKNFIGNFEFEYKGIKFSNSYYSLYETIEKNFNADNSVLNLIKEKVLLLKTEFDEEVIEDTIQFLPAKKLKVNDIPILLYFLIVLYYEPNNEFFKYLIKKKINIDEILTAIENYNINKLNSYIERFKRDKGYYPKTIQKIKEDTI